MRNRTPNYDMLPEHMREGMRRYYEEGIIPGDFLTAVLENNLVKSFGLADDINIERMFDFCDFLYNELPTSAWGSPENVQIWATAIHDKRKKERLHIAIKKVINDGPDRVIVNSEGEAKPWKQAHDLGFFADIIFIRDDGWSLGAPNALERIAYEMWSDLWTYFIRKPDIREREIKEYR